MTGREWKRVYGSKERVQWIARQRCVFCGEGPCDNAHVTNGGLGRKAGYEWIVPACHPCHVELDHGIGKKAMECKYKCNLRELARTTASRWQKTLDPGDC